MSPSQAVAEVQTTTVDIQRLFSMYSHFVASYSVFTTSGRIYKGSLDRNVPVKLHSETCGVLI